MGQPPADELWVKLLNDAKDKFEANAVLSTWRVEVEDPLGIDNVEIADGIFSRAG